MTDSKSKRLELRQGFERTDLTFSIAKPLPGLRPADDGVGLYYGASSSRVKPALSTT
jgi:hypothetical protein